MQLNLSADDSAALTQHTEGWIAGLQLAALSLQNSEDPAGFVAAFAGSHRYIVDYLVEEVLDRQPEATQSFLVFTSILERMSGSLCDALTGRSDGQKTLRELEQANLFVTALDHERHWYRYHQLFADVLRSRLRQSHPDRLAELHRRAAGWHEQNGSVSEAISHALAGRDQDHAARLVERSAKEGMMNRVRKFLLLTILLLLVIPLISAARRSPSPVGQIDVPLTQALVLAGGESTNPRENDPATTHSSGDKRVFSGLVSFDPHLNLTPDLAESWDVSPDGTVYTFHLRQNVRFHDGRAVTAQDVIYSWERAASPAVASDTVLTYLGDIVGVDKMVAGQSDHISGLKALDDRTLQVRIDAPKP